MKLGKLHQILLDTGIEIFPEYDAFCYIEGQTCEKLWPLEKHVYENMGILANVHNFAWSRWNLNAGRRNIIMQLREYKIGSPKQVVILIVEAMKSV